MVGQDVDSLGLERVCLLASQSSYGRQRWWGGDKVVSLVVIFLLLLRTYSVVRLEVVNLFPKHQRPQVLAEEFNHVQRIRETRSVPREPVRTP